MKILHVTEGVSDLATGQIAVVKNLIKYQGVSNNIGLFSIDFSTNVNIDGLNNYYIYRPSILKWKYSREAFLELKRIITRYDIIHIHGVWMYPQYIACKLASRLRIPFIITPHGMLSNWFINNNYRSLKYKIYMYLLFNDYLQKSSLIHTLSERETDDLLKLCNDRNKVVEIPNGIELKNINSKENIDLKNKYLLFIGRIHPIKGLDLLLSAWIKVYNRYPNYRLIVIGNFHNKKYKSYIYGIIQNNPTKFRVLFKGPVFGEKKWKYLKGCTAFIQPSRYEASSITLLEAASIPKPIIVSNEAVLKGMEHKHSVLITKPTIDSIKENLICLLKMKAGELMEMKNNLSILIKDNHEIEKVVENNSLCYNKILNDD